MVSMLVSQRPDITESIPTPLSAQGERAARFAGDKRFDVNINRLPFLLHINDEFRYQRGQDAVQKQQFDSSREAGEQSLGLPWRRSQTSWHAGAGAEWYEPGSDELTQNRFKDSHNVDVWTPGEIRLLPAMSSVADGLSGTVTLSTARRAGVNGFVSAAGTAVAFRDGTGTSVVSGTLGSSGATQPAIVGSVAYVGGTNRVSSWSFTGAGTVTLLRTLTGSARCWWVKSRLLVAVANKLYWVDLNASAGIALGSATDLLVAEHPDPEWVWSDVAESPDAILATGYSAATSAIYSVTVTETGGVPEFTAARQVAALPPGEWATCMGTYLSTYAVLGTSKGVRVGLLSDGGGLTYGPLTVETAQPVVDVTFSDRWAYLPVTANLADGSTGVVRVDLSQGVGDTGFYAWAWDVSTGSTDTASAVCFVGGQGSRPVVAAGDAVYMTGVEAAAEGWLESGQIRFATTEQKDFQRAAATGSTFDGEVEILALAGGATTKVFAYDVATGMGREAEVRVGSSSLFDRMAFRLVLRRLSGPGPVVESFTVKALPAVAKSRLIRFPLGCWDSEKNRRGQSLGYEGFSWDRLFELEGLDDKGEPVVVQDRLTGEAFTATIESVDFTSSTAPDGSRANAGGVIELTLRRR